MAANSRLAAARDVNLCMSAARPGIRQKSYTVAIGRLKRLKVIVYCIGTSYSDQKDAVGSVDKGIVSDAWDGYPDALA